MTDTDNGGTPPPGSRYTFGAKPTIGAANAFKAVAQDTSELVRAEIELAKAELAEGMKANGVGLGLVIGAAVLMWLAVQGLLIFFGFLLALWVPGWAAALIVTVVLLLIAAILGLMARRKLGTPVSVDQAKTNVQEDVAWLKTHLPRR
jgi:uncharacterized membrane protein YqjE